MSKHERYIEILSKIAEAQEPVSRMRLAALLVYKNDIISVGYNRVKSHPFQKQFSRHEEAIYLHAETHCVLNALRSFDVDLLPKCTMYVCRVKHPDDNHQTFIRAMAKPCSGCQRCLAEFGIERVVYTTESGHEWL